MHQPKDVKVMIIPVYVSKKGTKVVRAFHLHQALGISKDYFPKDVKRWIKDLYQFNDGIRNPERYKDFAKREAKEDQLIDDYYLSVELAKLVTLNSRSKHKLKYAKYLSAQESDLGQAERISSQQVKDLLELTKVMSYISCQLASEKKHLQQYEHRNGGNAANWWKFRASILGYSVEELRKRLQDQGQQAKGKTQRQLLLEIDRFEVIRAAIIDLFMGNGKSEAFARKMGDLAKIFAKALNVEVVDDRQAMPIPFTASVNHQLAQAIKDGIVPDSFFERNAAATKEAV
ncbi:MAG: hypothetical protein AAFU60_00060 [Bacteroidota bacterium]